MDRRNLAVAALCAAFLIIFPLTSFTFAEEGAGLSGEQLRQEVLDNYPGVRLNKGGDWIQFYGRPMNFADTPEEAIENWLSMHAGALGAPMEEFEFRTAIDIKWGQFVCYHYHQAIDGVPVKDTVGRIMALQPSEDDDSRPGWSVVYACTSQFVQSPKEGLARVNWTAEQSIESIQSSLEYGDMALWTGATRAAVKDSAGNIRHTWKFAGKHEDKALARAFDFYVDVRNGDLVLAQSAVFHDDIDGTVTGMATPGTNPDYSGNPPSEMAMPGIWIDGPGSDNVYADLDGAYVLEDLPDSSQTVEVTLWGEWVDVDTDQGSEEELDDSATPPATLDFLFNADEEQYELAQVNVFIHTQYTHNFMDDYSDISAIDTRLKANTNLISSCNAYFTTFGPSINFFHSAGGCVNTAYSSVVAHEYGHYIVYELGLAQGAFGEGFSDSVSIMQYDDYQVGRRFFGGSLPIRNPKNANRQYPCSGGVHYCGETVGGSWSELLDNFKETYGDEDGLEEARVLFGAWASETSGGFWEGVNHGSHPGTAIEVLTVDDNDGLLDNGTPNYDDICDAYDQHGIDCPEIDALIFDYPDGRPDFIDTDGTTTFIVEIVDIGEIADGDTAEVFYSVNGGSYDSDSLVSLGDGQYEVEIPPSDCADIIEYYIRVEDTGGTAHLDPLEAPTGGTYQAQVADELLIEFEDDFQSDEGWEVDPDGDDDAEDGIWERVTPVGNSSAPIEDFTPGDVDGMCFVTGVTAPGGSQSSNDVDGGRTTLLSPVIDMSATTGAYTVSYYRWYCNRRGADPTGDVWRVDIRNSDVSEWVNVELITEDHPRGWVFVEFEVTDYVFPTTTMELRFIVEDNEGASVVEAALDDFRVDLLECEGYVPDDPPSGEGTFQRGDVDGDGEFNFNDVFEFLNVVFLGETEAFDCDEAFDIDNNGTTSVTDCFFALEYQLLGGTTPATPFFACGFDFDTDGLTCDEASTECD